MKYFIVSVRDSAVGAFMQPWFAPAQAAAQRAFGDLVKDSKDGNIVHMHPEDYDLYHVGYWDDQKGLVEHLDIPEVICRGKDLVKSS